MLRHDSRLDTLGRRTATVMEGTAFAASHHWDYGYNYRSELTEGYRREGTAPDEGDPMTPGLFDYTYDPIGNRTETNVDISQNPMTYTTNSVNQYTATAYPTEAFTHDADGNLVADGTYAFTWDGENRLIQVVTQREGNPQENDRKLEFKYDYMSRRVEKKYSVHNGTTWVVQSQQRFVYDEWNVVLVLDGLDSNAVTSKYTWGLDLSGLSGDTTSGGIHGAGGIGGLLAAVETGGDNQGSYWFLYDGNGNVGQVLDTADLDGDPAAKYEYDPYGNQLVSTGTYAAANPFRFSTKWFDTEVDYPGTSNDGLYYYGYRYYLPRLGRWVSRDPIGSRNRPGPEFPLYPFADNGPVIKVDSDGRALVPVVVGILCAIPPCTLGIVACFNDVEEAFLDCENDCERKFEDPDEPWDLPPQVQACLQCCHRKARSDEIGCAISCGTNGPDGDYDNCLNQ